VPKQSYKKAASSLSLLAVTRILPRAELLLKKMRKKIISVIGGHNCTPEVEQIAQKLGKKLAKVANILACGGLSGVMEAVCQGFKAGGGITLGIIPSYDKKTANKFVDIVIPTGIGLARNALVVQAGDIVVALPGEYGTLSEIAYCKMFAKPVISLGSWDIPGLIQVKSVEQAVKKAKELLIGAQKSPAAKPGMDARRLPRRAQIIKDQIKSIQRVGVI